MWNWLELYTAIWLYCRLMMASTCCSILLCFFPDANSLLLSCTAISCFLQRILGRWPDKAFQQNIMITRGVKLHARCIQNPKISKALISGNTAGPYDADVSHSCGPLRIDASQVAFLKGQKTLGNVCSFRTGQDLHITEQYICSFQRPNQFSIGSTRSIVAKLDFWVASVLRLLYFSEMRSVTIRCLTSWLYANVQGVLKQNYMTWHDMARCVRSQWLSQGFTGMCHDGVLVDYHSQFAKTASNVPKHGTWKLCGSAVTLLLYIGCSFQKLTQFGDTQKT